MRIYSNKVNIYKFDKKVGDEQMSIVGDVRNRILLKRRMT